MVLSLSMRARGSARSMISLSASGGSVLVSNPQQLTAQQRGGDIERIVAGNRLPRDPEATRDRIECIPVANAVVRLLPWAECRTLSGRFLVRTRGPHPFRRPLRARPPVRRLADAPDLRVQGPRRR